jgi:hypothetical protein
LRELLAQLIEFLLEAIVRAVAVMVMKRPFTPADQEMNRSAMIFRNDTITPIKDKQSFVGDHSQFLTRRVSRISSSLTAYLSFTTARFRRARAL